MVTRRRHVRGRGRDRGAAFVADEEPPVAVEHAARRYEPRSHGCISVIGYASIERALEVGERVGVVDPLDVEARRRAARCRPPGGSISGGWPTGAKPCGARSAIGHGENTMYGPPARRAKKSRSDPDQRRRPRRRRPGGVSSAALANGVGRPESRRCTPSSGIVVHDGRRAALDHLAECLGLAPGEVEQEVVAAGGGRVRSRSRGALRVRRQVWSWRFLRFAGLREPKAPDPA